MSVAARRSKAAAELARNSSSRPVGSRRVSVTGPAALDEAAAGAVWGDEAGAGAVVFWPLVFWVVGESGWQAALSRASSTAGGQWREGVIN